MDGKNRVGQIGKFYLSNNFKFHGKVIEDTPTHWIIDDFVKECEIEILKSAVVTVYWERE